jgi:hypothetical protein
MQDNVVRLETHGKFDEFWAAWYGTAGKRYAKEIFFKLISPEGKWSKLPDGTKIHLRASPQQLIDAAIRYREENCEEIAGKWYPLLEGRHGQDGPKKLPHASTWLNQGRYEDYE